MVNSVIILGATARSACLSAQRAGIAAFAGDLFADSDTQMIAQRTLRISGYPEGCLEALASFPNVPWMYCGALENHPALLGRMEQVRPLLGNSAAVVRAVRDPIQVTAALRSAGMPFAESRLSIDNCDSRNTCWLRKPLQSAGGIGIEFAARDNTCEDGRYYWQQYIDGAATSAVFVAGDHRTELLGTTYQLIGEADFGAHDFRFAGNIAPGPCDSSLIEQINGIGNIISETFSLRGLFGIDGIVADGKFYTVEVNPRFTASVEVIEMLRPESLVELHVNACCGLSTVSTDPRPQTQHRAFAGKAIIFAKQDVVVDDGLLRQLRYRSGECRYADIPQFGEPIRAGRPIATTIAVGTSRSAVKTRLKQLAKEAYASLTATGSN